MDYKLRIVDILLHFHAFESHLLEFPLLNGRFCNFTRHLIYDVSTEIDLILLFIIDLAG